MKPTWMATTMIAMAEAAAAATPFAICQRTLTVWLESGQVADLRLLTFAEATATRVFAQVGVRLQWRGGLPGRNLPCGENLEVALEAEVPARFAPDVLAYATVGAARTTIHVFYHRVVREHTPQLAPFLLGHVFAHEITHVLENVARHSAEGVLKANWGAGDFAAMTTAPLPFDPIDAEMVRAHFGL